ncbi:hypothetical protein B0H11DRAFT_1907379 [Mycena galericulata]|nr:hypothetical protein B0H11DRAFT_1920856 [Mycena galericulata]KAJ7502265.1 hypothetical protein B0H11DRAFT_1907379 [Mycena galericulata]
MDRIVGVECFRLARDMAWVQQELPGKSESLPGWASGAWQLFILDRGGAVFRLGRLNGVGNLGDTLAEVPDDKSLKSCALVASNFREPSQRLLFHSLIVDTYQKMSNACTFLTELPYIAEYIRRFGIQFAQMQSLPLEAILILTKLQKVQHLSIAGNISSEFAATPLPALPYLQSIEIRTSFFSTDRRWLDVTSHILTAANSAPLEDVIVSYRLHHVPRIAPTDVGLLLDLEQSLLSHPAAPRIRWHLGYGRLDFSELAGLKGKNAMLASSG